MHVLLDVSRLIAAAKRRTPSGIDRVEAAYVRHWLGQPAGAVTFVGRSPWRDFVAVPRTLVADLHACVEQLWTHAGLDDRMATAARGLARRAGLALALGVGRRDVMARLQAGRRSALLLVSHRLMERPEPIARLRRRGTAFVPLVHDLIPATHPEYARPGVALQHLRRLSTVARLADGILVNSNATRDALLPHLAGQDHVAPIRVAPLGLDLPGIAPASRPSGSYFVAIGTIEPRKNHLLLLQLWRDFAEKYGSAAPRLLLVGRRGWENEQILDMLERCTLLRGLVEERGELPDAEVAGLLRGARALLFPSFAEGYGLPLAEALACGVPAICSDLPALREVGGAVPEYLDPLDGAGWRRAILDYAEPESNARRAQLGRLDHWQAPHWDDHFCAVDELLARVTGRSVVRAGALMGADALLAAPRRNSASPRPEPVVAAEFRGS